MTLDDIIGRLKEKGVKLTPQRQEVIRVLMEGEHMSADDILQQVKDRYAGVSFDTIYRTLNLFKALKLVNELDFMDGCRRYEINHEGQHHHHLVCLKCGRAQELPFCPADCLARVQNYSPEFKICGHMFKIYGYCQSCQ